MRGAAQSSTLHIDAVDTEKCDCADSNAGRCHWKGLQWSEWLEEIYWRLLSVTGLLEGCAEENKVWGKVKHEQVTRWSVQPQMRSPLVSRCSRVCACWRLHVSECVSECCSNRRVGEDSLIQLSSVDSIANPLHLLKQLPQKTHPSPSSMCLH